MKAMILAAGFGTRLKPLTDHKPKALVEINGTPLLELLIQKLIRSCFRDIIINAHHFAGLISDFLKSKQNFHINIELSLETEILGTGGGIKKAAYFFNDGQPFLVHNVDIITDMDITKLYHYHLQYDHLATLAIMRRETDRHFIMDEEGLICGHVDKKKNLTRMARDPMGTVQPVAFTGIHLISPKIFPLIRENDHFSIIDLYLRLITEGYSIGSYNIEGCYWRDIGKIGHLKQVEDDFKNGLIEL